ncbi:hypothetical protein WKK_05225 [Weissella koreensis KACC 15510]|nr:hypothetical protein WKK_05225 [Weissella koreensis KACC 15510]
MKLVTVYKPTRIKMKKKTVINEMKKFEYMNASRIIANNLIFNEYLYYILGLTLFQGLIRFNLEIN